MHYSVLLDEAIELLAIKPSGTYVDGTFGRGGHSRAILDKLGAGGRLIAFDKDPEAISYASINFANDTRFNLIHDSFANIEFHLNRLGISEVDGVLLDLGVSSPQLDTPVRGFSFRFDAPLDMRMNNQSGQSAAEWLNRAEEIEIADVFWRYGEEKFSRRIAKAVVTSRKSRPLLTTTDLANLVSEVIPFREKGQHPATRVFQAVRIHINNELADLEQILAVTPKYLALHGRLVVISFHSLEDRIVKVKFNQLSTAQKLPKWVMANPSQDNEFGVVAKKIKASEGEIAENNRSRSAIMRCLERIQVKET